MCHKFCYKKGSDELYFGSEFGYLKCAKNTLCWLLRLSLCYINDQMLLWLQVL